MLPQYAPNKQFLNLHKQLHSTQNVKKTLQLNNNNTSTLNNTSRQNNTSTLNNKNVNMSMPLHIGLHYHNFILNQKTDDILTKFKLGNTFLPPEGHQSLTLLYDMPNVNVDE